ncbi:TolC family protein [Curvibacter delicatus]|jgi:cobalt-zinc-cadmium efflux system outer membrane protein|uniref:TolC family protein n=1 Tax=Curvibacter delicatus TaxID=80879 RepID=UPI0009FCAD88|nr:TolC family protein [Curvibacter delicatus]
MSIRQFFLLSSLLLALPALAQAPASATVSLEQALQAARNNLDVALARNALAAARADIVSANRAPLPVLTTKLSQMDLQNGIGEGNFMTEKRVDKSIGLDWTWERGNKRELRTLTAERAATAAQADLDEIRTQQLLGVQAGFYNLLAAQERLTQVTQIERSAAQLAITAQKRVQAGDLAAQDAARTEIEAQRARSDVQLAELDRQRAALMLWQFTGLPTPPEQLQAQTGWPALTGDMPMTNSLDTLVDARPDVRAAQARVQAAQAALDGSTALRRSDITWGASYDHYPGTSTALIELRMQMPLQWGYSYQGEIARANAQLAQAQDGLERTRRQARAELQRLQQEALNTAQRARAYEVDILPRARKVAEGAELAYSKGAMSLTDLLDARRTLRATLLDALTARADYAKAAGAWQLRTQAEATAAAPTPSN